MISKRIEQTASPPLVKLGQLAQDTENCISLGQGAPHYAPNIEFIQNNFFNNLNNSYHQYTSDPGIPQLRELISDKLSTDNKFNTDPNDIVITPGANQAFINVLITITDPGDKIILISPYYFNHAMACTMFGVESIEVPLLHDFSIDYHTLEHIIKGIRLRKAGFNGTSQIGATIDISKGMQAQKDKKEIFIYNSPVCHLNNMRAFTSASNWFAVIGNWIHQW